MKNHVAFVYILVAVNILLMLNEVQADPPLADFIASNTVPQAGETVTFTDLSSNNPISSQWSFPDEVNFIYVDGTNEYSQNPHVQFYWFGSFDVCLQVHNPDGGDKLCKKDYINISLVADFYTSNTFPCVEQSVLFTDNSTGASSPWWYWQFDPPTVTFVGGTSASSQNPMVEFNEMGYYTVTLMYGDWLIMMSDTEIKMNYVFAFDCGGGGGYTKLWNGYVSDNWDDPNNWTPFGIPAVSDNVLILPVSGTSFSPILITDVTINGLELREGAIFTNPVGTLLTVTGTTKVCGIFNQEGKDIFCILIICQTGVLIVGPFGYVIINCAFTNNGVFKIESDCYGSAGCLIDNGGIGGSGTFELDRCLLSGPNNSPSGWHYISSPVNNTVTGDFVGYWFKGWDPSANYFFDIDPCINCCTAPSQFDFPLIPMKGYSVKLDYDYNCLCESTFDTIEFGGDHQHTHSCVTGQGCVPLNLATQKAFMSNVNTGPYNINVNWNGIPGDPISGPFHEWNLIGNPYSAPIDNASFVSRFPSQVDGAIYFYENSSLNYKYWAGGLGSPQVPATQGFMVKVNTAGSWNIGLLNSDRTINGAGNFYKTDIPNVIILEASGKGYKDEIFIRFMDEAIIGFDSKWDAYKLISEADFIPQIYTIGGEEKLAINALPRVSNVNMGFVANGAGEFTIQATETSEFKTVLLEDKATGIITDMLTNSYSFNYKAGDDENRFVIHFGDISTETESGGFVIYSSQGNIVVYNINNQQGDVYVYNVVGQLMGSVSLQDGINNITLDNAQGYYIVNVRTSENVVNKKVYIH